MVAPGAKSEDSELNDCDKVPRRLYNLQCPIAEEESDDASENYDEAYELQASLSGMSRKTQEMWDSYDESKTQRTYQRTPARSDEGTQNFRDSGSRPGGGNLNMSSKFLSSFFDDEPDDQQQQQQQPRAPQQRRQQMWDKFYPQQAQSQHRPVQMQSQ